MRNLRKKRLKVTLDGEIMEFASIRDASDALDINYLTLRRWANGENKPTIDIKVDVIK